MQIIEAIKILGPVGDVWDFEEVDLQRLPNGSYRSLLKVEIAKKFFTQNKKHKTEWISHTAWGTGATSDHAIADALGTNLMWLGLNRPRSEALGIQSILDALGPVGLNWGFSLAESTPMHTHGGWFRNKVEIEVRKSLLGFGRSTAMHRRHEYGVAEATDRKDVDPSEIATIKAVRKCAQSLGIIPAGSDPAPAYAEQGTAEPRHKRSGFLAKAAGFVLTGFGSFATQIK